MSVTDDSMYGLILWGQQQLEQADVYFGHGTDNALDESAYLMAHSMGIEPDFSDDLLQQPVPADRQQQFMTLIQQRIETRLPAAYLTHEAWFAGLAFYVNQHVLVPRSPIAELIMEGFAPWIDITQAKHALDLCTGSGCIGIALARYFPHLQVDISDISEQALQVARENIQRLDVAKQVSAYHADLFNGLPKGKQYDLIVSNPPYVDAEDMASLPEEYRHEPELGLTAGEDGLQLVIPMLQQAAHYLRPGGILVVEVGNSETALQAAFPEVPFTWLEFEFGGHGVFLLDYEQILAYGDCFNKADIQK